MAAKDFFHKLLNYRLVLILYVVIAGITAVQKYVTGDRNNYRMFSRPIYIMMDGGNMYVEHTEHFNDIYKYSPTFPVLFAPFSLLPDLAGVILFNLLNAVLLFVAVRMLLNNEKKCCLLLLIVLPELVISLQNFQINGIVAELFILPFVQFERGKPILAAFFICLSFYIKIYGIIPALLFLFYPGKLKFVLCMAIFMLLFFALPLLIISPSALITQYNSWFSVVNVSATGSQLSVMGLLNTWFHTEVPHRTVQLTGLLIMLLPLLKMKEFVSLGFRMNYLASLMVFSVLFNQMAESPTYIIAMTGFGIWFVNREVNAWSISLLVLALLFTSLSPSDLFPRSLREGFFMPYRIKALPVLIAWIVMQLDLWMKKSVKTEVLLS